MRVIDDEGLVERSAEPGAWLLSELRKLKHPHIKEVRGRGDHDYVIRLDQKRVEAG